MSKLLICTMLAVLLTGCAASAGESVPTRDAPRLGALKNYTPVKPPNCACEIFLDPEQKAAVLVSDLEGEDARMNIDGKDVSLTLHRQLLRSELDPNAGKGFERLYLHGTTPIRAVFEPGPYQGGEEVGAGAREGSPMHVTFSIPNGAHTEVRKGSGMCGC